jgi:hypothetical protein
MNDEPELTAEIAAKLFGPKDLNQPEPEPEIEGRPPKDKPVSEYTEEERAANEAHYQRILRMQERERQEQEGRLREEAMRTPEQIHNDTVNEMVGHDRKRQSNEALIRSLHPPGDKPA